jgi:hypothetical protein
VCEWEWKIKFQFASCKRAEDEELLMQKALRAKWIVNGSCEENQWWHLRKFYHTWEMRADEGDKCDTDEGNSGGTFIYQHDRLH